MRNLQVRIKRPPSRPADLELIETDRPALTNGSFLARALWLAVDRAIDPEKLLVLGNTWDASGSSGA